MLVTPNVSQLKKTAAASLATALVTGLVATLPIASATADPPTTQVVTPADFLPAPLSDTRSAGHYDFRASGIHLWTDDSSSNAKVAEYFPLSGSLADMVGAARPAWTGTGGAPGSQIVFDADGITGNGNDFNILVGEAAYPGDDWWLSSGSSGTAKAAAPLTTGGSGSAWHGNLADWAAALPGARVYAGGFSLGSGVKGDGMLTSLTFGTTEYRFAGLGACDVDVDGAASTITLLSDCQTPRTLIVDDGWTLDGDGHTIIATETPSTTFKGAVVTNDGPVLNVRDLTITTNADWAAPGKNSGGKLYGILLTDAGGSIEDVTVSGISHGNGVQEGNAVDVNNPGGATQRLVTIDKVTVRKYQKTGIRINGNVKATLTNSRISAAGTPDTGAPLDHVTAANSLQISRGATAVVTDNRITGNDWDGSPDWSASGVLFYQSGAVTFERNVVDGAGVDFGVISEEAAGSVKVRCNLVTRTADGAGDLDIWNTGIGSYDDAAFSAVDNTISGYETPTDGVTNIVNQGRCAPAVPTVTVDGITATRATVHWSGTDLLYAPTSGWVLTGPTGIVELPSGTTSYTVGGLQAGRDYAVSVRAVDVSGQSPAANATFVTKGTTPPAAKTSTIGVSPALATYHQRVTASGRLMAGPTGSAGVTVTVSRQLGTGWAVVGTTKTNASGSWSLTFGAEASGAVRATAAGYPTASASLAVTPKVKAKGKRHAVKVKVRPLRPGLKVKLYRIDTTSLTKVAAERLDGRSKAVFTGLAKGYYFVKVKKSAGLVTTLSPVVRVR